MCFVLLHKGMKHNKIMKRTLKVLSIDFDYFQDTTADTIIRCYPDGIDMPTKMSTLIWSFHYMNKHQYEMLKQVKILENELNILKSIMMSDNNIQSTSPVMITNSHVHIYDFIHENMKTYDADKVNIINIDMHHDMFNQNTELDCGNWIYHIVNDFKENANVSWITNPISLETYGIDKDKMPNIYTTIDTIKNFKFDIVFLCRSDNWLPPHLDTEFNNLLQLIRKRFNNINTESCIEKPRKIFTP